MHNIYFDNAATTPLDPEVLDAMLPFLKDHFGNPSSTHRFGRETRAAIEVSRRKMAELLNISPGELFFTSGGTEADNMAIRCAVEDLGVDHIITSPIEHHAVLHTVQHIEQEGKARVSFVRSIANGHIDLEHLALLLKENKNTLVTLMHANNEIGNMIDLKEVGTRCKENGAFFHSDTVQTMAHYRFDLSALPVDMVNGSAHKFHGPKGIGFIYINSDIKISPILFGGSQERNMRAGTENIYGIIGMAKALEIANREMEAHQKHVMELKKYMIDALISCIPQVQFNGDTTGEQSLYTVLSVRLPETSFSEMLLYKLDIEGIACSGGSACSSGSNKGSHVMEALYPGTTGPNVRFSFSKFNTKEEVDHCVGVLKKIFEVAYA